MAEIEYPERMIMCWYDGNREPEVIGGTEDVIVAMMESWGPMSKELYSSYIFFLVDITYSTDGI